MIPPPWLEKLIFEPTTIEVEKIRKWINKHKCELKSQDCDGFTKFHLIFGRSGMGNPVTVSCDCGAKEDMTDWDSF